MNYTFKSQKNNKANRNSGKADSPHPNHSKQPSTDREATKEYILSTTITAQRTATSRTQTSLESTKRQATASMA